MSFEKDIRFLAGSLLDYYRESAEGKGPVLRQRSIKEIHESLNLEALAGSGGLSGETLAKFMSAYYPNTTRLHHPHYLAHQVAVPHLNGAVGALVDGFTNQPMSIYEMGPGAAAIEFFVVNWLLEKIDWVPMPTDPSVTADSSYAGGALTHGGSMATLTALVCARSKVVPDVWENGTPGDLVILSPQMSHYAVARAAGIMGLGHNAILEVQTDKTGVVMPDKLPAVLARLRLEGKRPLAMVANACSTGVGRYDPLVEIGAFCREHDIWLHVDGAHGAGALLSDKYRYRLEGIETADSVIWDMHKMMRTSGVCAAVLIKNHAHLDQAFQQEGDYIFHDKAQPGVDFISRTLECTKAGLGLKFFFVLAAEGERGLAEYVDRQYDLTLAAYDYIAGLPDFQCAAKPQSNILCFRTNHDDKWHLTLRDHLIAEGSFYLSTTAVGDIRYLRFVAMSPQTTLDDIKALIDRIRRYASEFQHDTG
ncbi:MAG: aminotransferase class V-fold PLP-dependent enzyme [Desulfobacteraceae bacterium]|nr:aminotransferase class V-fold PLP-dependent enzyme [Desulfobacteraceae bacterium]